ncbi:hypothetical protein [Amphibacillus xylanus]|uniref:Uncharacterized protein n=1 Tax=Amphibacillus xylanus (strain ATCC 51415 / DSM 6626 / JCM 7361 / LMG 17667 / NBRC 15112 / Ep01) TaxID=698758 RepID=K0IW63_AMPXN|nr:hypothetical protein [Amphibacillus xylanus]BAM46594.1 hypothetical protein AXY_04620 [Amphibacillus xylanus NBRC 15112]
MEKQENKDKSENQQGVKNLLIFAFMISDLLKGQVKNGDFDNSRMAKRKSLDMSKRQPNYIEIS